MTFTKENLNDIRHDITHILSGYGNTNNVKFKLGNITYDSNSFRVTLKAFSSEDGTVDTGKIEFEKYCYKFYVPKDWYGKNFLLRNEEYKIVGIKSRARKYPVVIQNIKTGNRKSINADFLRTCEFL